MDEVKINTSKTLTLTIPTDPTANTVSVSLYHEFGDLVSGPTNATRTGTGVYTITFGQKASGEYVLNSAGKYRADFSFTIAGTPYTRSQYFNVYTPYIDSTEFFLFYPELQNDFGSIFDRFERRARNVINTYCGQAFDYYPNKSMTLDGNDHTVLQLPIPIFNISKVTMNLGDENETILHTSTEPGIEKYRTAFNFQSSYYIKYKAKEAITEIVSKMKFLSSSNYKIEGDFGWSSVPDNVQQAAALLIADFMNNDNEYRAHGMTSVDMDSISFQMKSSFYESTGNIEADVLLMDYTLFVMDYI